MNEKIELLLNILNTVKTLFHTESLDNEDVVKLKAIEYGGLALLINQGVNYSKSDFEYRVLINDNVYSVPTAYVEAYLGKSDFNKKDITLSFSENKLFKKEELKNSKNVIISLEKYISHLYQEDVLKNNSLDYLKKRVSFLTRENNVLKIELEKEQNKTKALSDKINIILGTTTLSEFNNKANFSEDSYILTNIAEVEDMATIEAKPILEKKVEVHYEDVDEKSDYAFNIGETNITNIDNGFDEDSGIAQYGVFPYKENYLEMSSHEFTFVYQKIYLKNADDTIMDFVEVLTIPLTLQVKNPDILVWIAKENETVARVIKGKSDEIIDLESFKIKISGVVKNKTFKSYITRVDNGENRIEIESKDNGSQGHLYFDYLSYKIHICPVTFKNSEDGYADFVYCIEKDGAYIQAGDNSEGEVIFMDENGNMKKLGAKWRDGALYGAVLEVKG